MIELALMFCFPVVEDIQGFIRLGNPVTVSQGLTHGQILSAIKIGGVPSDSYICSNDRLNKNVLDPHVSEYRMWKDTWLGR